MCSFISSWFHLTNVSVRFSFLCISVTGISPFFCEVCKAEKERYFFSTFIDVFTKLTKTGPEGLSTIMDAQPPFLCVLGLMLFPTL